MTAVDDLHAGWMRDADYRDAFDALAVEFDLAAALVRARTRLTEPKSWSTDRTGGRAMFKRIVHPGEVLLEELEAVNVTPAELARQIDVPPNRVGQIIAGKCAITGDTALRLGHWFGVDPQFWLNLQAQCDRAVADPGDGGGD